MKKIGLITYTKSPNYGAALQLFATYVTLKDMGYDISIINYQNDFESEKHGIKYLFSGIGIKEIARELISSYIFGVKKNAKHNFTHFYQQMKYSPKLESINELSLIGDYDVYCVGSDQVWNPRITNGFDDVFILNTALPIKKISYASSMGSCTLDGYSDEIFIKSLKTFKYISVREKIAYKYLSAKINKDIKQVVDPTMLIERGNWNKLIDLHSAGETPAKEKYVLIYALGGQFEKNRLLANIIASKIGAKIYAISLSNRNRKIDKVITNATPLDFVRYIRSASFVVTNSFHGTCLSIIMRTPFYSVVFGSNPARAEDLLLTLGLSRRLYHEGDPVCEELLGKDDLNGITETIKTLSNDSREWLQQAIDG